MVELHSLNALLVNGNCYMIERIDRSSIWLCRLLHADGVVMAVWTVLPKREDIAR
jgi:hypothetical protein